jgi:hypothetical protein
MNHINITRFVMLLATEYLVSPLRYFKVPWAYIEQFEFNQRRACW